ncbi:hypothetical protein WKW79_16405 [Variovorax robiniae]|uniref:Uncharacterized protein n=1 Tax=Variovorax robiniae TaxID=1836199 RepID=A0ABU8XAV6_9BURK
MQLGIREPNDRLRYPTEAIGMKCPHCEARIGLLSKEMNELGKSRTCPHCGKGVKLGLVHTRFVLAFIPIAIAAIVLGLSGPVAAGIAGGIGAAFGMGLKSAEAWPLPLGCRPGSKAARSAARQTID